MGPKYNNKIHTQDIYAHKFLSQIINLVTKIFKKATAKIYKNILLCLRKKSFKILKRYGEISNNSNLYFIFVDSLCLIHLFPYVIFNYAHLYLYFKNGIRNIKIFKNSFYNTFTYKLY